MRSIEWIRAIGRLDQQKVWNAANEVLVEGAISLAPLVLAALGSHLSAVINNGDKIPLFQHLAQAILSGQLLFYAMSFVASIIWHSSQDLVRPFPLRVWFLFICFSIAMICALTIGVDPTLQKLSVPQVYVTSVAIYFVSAFLYFVILLFRRMEDVNFSQDLDREDREFGDQLKSSRGIV